MYRTSSSIICLCSNKRIGYGEARLISILLTSSSCLFKSFCGNCYAAVNSGHYNTQFRLFYCLFVSRKNASIDALKLTGFRQIVLAYASVGQRKAEIPLAAIRGCDQLSDEILICLFVRRKESVLPQDRSYLNQSLLFSSVSKSSAANPIGSLLRCKRPRSQLPTSTMTDMGLNTNSG